MVKLAYTKDLGSCAAMRAGSTPVTRTIQTGLEKSLSETVMKKTTFEI